MKPEALHIAATKEIELLEQGVPASSLDLRGVESQFLLDKVRQANIAWVNLTDAGELEAAQDMDGDIEALYRELRQRRASQKRREYTGRFLGRLFGRGWQS